MSLIPVYAFQKPPRSFKKSLFLAGPTPRDAQTPSWRPEALRILESLGYDGVVFIPEAADGIWRDDYLGQCDWETEHLHMADDIVFWVPRDLVAMPAFTTNVEFGLWIETGKVTFGCPDGSPKNTYLSYHAGARNFPRFSTLEETLAHAVAKLGDGAYRIDGERHVPLHAWRTPQFKQWYKMVREAGNLLHGARLEWVIRSPKNHDRIFLIALRANVYVAAEGRNKTNEIVLMRPNVSSVLLYYRPQPDCSIEDMQIVLVREFRSTVANERGFVWELPSGSSAVEHTSKQTAVEEVVEETGLVVSPDRLRVFESRQIAATFSSHHGALFSAELSDEEVHDLRGQEGVPHGFFIEGDADASERTFVEVHTLKDILHGTIHVDWSTLGMIYRALSAV